MDGRIRRASRNTQTNNANKAKTVHRSQRPQFSEPWPLPM